MQLHNSGRVSIVEDWLDLFDVDERLDRHPAVAIQGSRIHAAQGRAEDADRWLHAAERGVASRRKGVATVRPQISIMRSALCSEGPTKMQADAELAVARLPKDDAWAPAALLVQGAAALLLGDVDRGDSILERRLSRPRESGRPRHRPSQSESGR